MHQKCVTVLAILDGLVDDDDDAVEGLHITYTDADGDG